MDVDVDVEGMEGDNKGKRRGHPWRVRVLSVHACMRITWSYPSLFPAFCPFTSPITMCPS